ncbi:MAG: hypothetical protein WD872_11280 [Pirellulaceae bacterium]
MLRRLYGTLAMLIGMLVLAPFAGAEAPSPANLAEAVERAKQTFEPVQAREVARAKAELASAASRLESWLQSSGTTNATKWKAYLGWNELQEILATDEPPAVESVDRLLGQLRANKRGLELAQFTRLRDALTRYADLASLGGEANLAEQNAQQLDRLATSLAAYQQNPGSGDDALIIGESLDWLARAGQSPRLQAAVRRQFDQPNLHASVSQRLAAVGMEQYVDTTTPVRDNILGTDLHGTARLTGRTTLVMHENPNAASLSILLGGTAISNNIGYNGPVTVHTTGATRVWGSKQLRMTADGLVGFRATARCSTNSTIHDICANCGLIEKIAWKRAGKQKSEAEAIGSSRAAARVATQMDRESSGLIAEQNQRYRERFKLPLVRRNAFPEGLRFSSSRDRAYVQMLQAGPSRLAAPDAPPRHEAAHDIAVRLHESLVVNYGESLLGGVELTDVRLEKLIRDELKGEVPEELLVTLPDGTLDPDKDPWSIIFAKDLPVRARFQDGGLWIAIRAEGFTRGEGAEPGTYKPAITELVEISATYKIERGDVGATLRREGDVQVRFPSRENPDQITIRDSAIVTFMRRKFRSMFKEEFVGEGIALKDRWAAAGTLTLAEIQSQQAWLTLGWQMPQQTAGAE